MLGAGVGLTALNNQRAQVNKLEELKSAQAAAAKTEAERLNIEKQRFELEKANMQEEKLQAEAVKSLRKLMADADIRLEGIMAKHQ